MLRGDFQNYSSPMQHHGGAVDWLTFRERQRLGHPVIPCSKPHRARWRPGDLLAPFPVAVLPDRQPVLALDDGAGALSVRNALKERKRRPRTAAEPPGGIIPFGRITCN
jgi:hypothetical protein